MHNGADDFSADRRPTQLDEKVKIIGEAAGIRRRARVTALGVDTRSSDAEWYLETDRFAAVLNHAQSTSTPGPRENPRPRLTHDELRLLDGFGQGHG